MKNVKITKELLQKKVGAFKAETILVKNQF